jgi:hypothetical protein
VSRKVGIVVACLVFAGALAGLILTIIPAPAAPIPEVTADVHINSPIMTSVYKTYGGGFSDLWLARTTIRNTGSTPIRNFRISYQVPGYLRTSSAENYPLILPGETVRDYCWPDFYPQQMRKIQSDTPAEVVATYTYDGLETPVNESEKFTFLGHNSFVYTYLADAVCQTFQDYHDNDPYLAAWVTYQDPTVQKLAKRYTSGLLTTTDQETWEAARDIYYGLQWRGTGYITEHYGEAYGHSTQYVQFPADTLRNHEGTCIDTSILYAAMLESVGVKTYLIGLLGHEMPAFELPESGRIVKVESTLLRLPYATFVDAIRSTKSTYAESARKGCIDWVDVEAEWQDGIVPSW